MTEILPANQEGYKRAITLLRRGELVGLPTDTVYGLAGLVDYQGISDKIFTVKNRPRKKPLSIVIFSPEQAKTLVHISPLAQAMMDEFWPGALTLVLPARNSHKTLALRCPEIGWRSGFMALGFDSPLFLPSANISGRPAPITARQVYDELGGKIPLILDGGTCTTQESSTIIAVDGDKARLLRSGALAPEQFSQFDIHMDLT